LFIPAYGESDPPTFDPDDEEGPSGSEALIAAFAAAENRVAIAAGLIRGSVALGRTIAEASRSTVDEKNPEE
jgi:hypothetical protein